MAAKAKIFIALALLTALPGTPVAAEQTFDEAMAAYERGDYDTAMRGFRVLAEQGNAAAQLELAAMYAQGEGVPENDIEALKWFRRAAEQGAEQGKAEFQYSLGVMYAQGKGVPKDDVEAVKWYRKAAEQGLAVAQFALGVIYEMGAAGVSEDDAEAVRWYRKAAEQGSTEAQLNLGAMYAEGRGVPENDLEAVKWYRKAAEQGNAGAQFGLSLMYAKGGGVPEDYVLAYAWLNLAAAQGQKEAVEAKDHLRPNMTAEQIARAQELSATLFNRINQSK